MDASTSLAGTPTRHDGAPAKLAGAPTSLAGPRMNLHGCVDEARRRPDEARWRPNESRWPTDETRRCASEARRRAPYLHGSTNQCSWAHLRASRAGVSGSLASVRVSSMHRTTLVTTENARKGPGQSFKGEAQRGVDAPLIPCGLRSGVRPAGVWVRALNPLFWRLAFLLALGAAAVRCSSTQAG